MNLLDSFFASGTGLTLVAIVIVLAFIGLIAFILYRSKQKKWAKYPLLFALFTLLMLVFDKIIGYRDMTASLIVSLTSGLIFALCIFLGDRSKEKKK